MTAARRRLVGGVVLSALIAVGCDLLVEPSGFGPQAIVISVPSSFGDVLSDVNRVHVRITRPDSVARDTVFQPEFEDRSIRARVVLRPDEGAIGTRVDIDLKEHAAFLFRASVVVGPDTGWPATVQAPLEPVGHLETGLGPSFIAFQGSTIPLAQEGTMRFDGGQSATVSGVTWTSTDPAVASVSGSTLTAHVPGQTELHAQWTTFADTVLVDVHPIGETYVSDTTKAFYLGSTEMLSDTLDVTDSPIGDVGLLSAVVDPAYPWLAASLSDPAPPSRLAISVDASLMSGSEVGIVTLRSSVAGIPDLPVMIDARLDPPSPTSRSWDPFCLVGDSLSTPRPGLFACMSMQVSSWQDGSDVHVRIVAENLQGSVGDSLDTSVRGFRVTGWGLDFPNTGCCVELVGLRTVGSVHVRGPPNFHQERTHTLDIQGTPRTSTGSLIGCHFAFAPSYFRTCDPDGFTGAVRADFRVNDPGWDLMSASAFMDFIIPSTLSLDCRESHSFCMVIQ